MRPGLHGLRDFIAAHKFTQRLAIQFHDNLALFDVIWRRSAHSDARFHASSIMRLRKLSMKKLVLSIIALLGSVAIPALAHHAFSAEFDLNKPVNVKGVVTKIEWMNPHAWFYVDVKTDSGVEQWQFETGAPIELSRRGWRKNDLKVGDEVTVQGLRAKDGTNTGSARMVTLPSGKKVFSGSAGDDAPAPPAQPPSATHE